MSGWWWMTVERLRETDWLEPEHVRLQGCRITTQIVAIRSGPQDRDRIAIRLSVGCDWLFVLCCVWCKADGFSISQQHCNTHTARCCTRQHASTPTQEGEKDEEDREGGWRGSIRGGPILVSGVEMCAQDTSGRLLSPASWSFRSSDGAMLADLRTQGSPSSSSSCSVR